MARPQEDTGPTLPSGPTTGEPRWLSDDEQTAWRTYLMATKRLLGRLEHDFKAQELMLFGVGLFSVGCSPTQKTVATMSVFHGYRA